MAEEKPPKELTKYYACNEFSYDALKNNYLWASNPLQFNDPCDCSIKAWEEQTFREDIVKKHIPNFSEKSFPISNRDQVIEVLLSKLGIICLNNNEKEFEDIIWGYYSNHSGFSISFNLEILSKDLNRTTPEKVNYKRVDELERFGLSDNTDEFPWTVRSWVSQKKLIWKPENEWRYIFFDIDYENSSSRKKYYKQESINKVTLGLNFFGKNREPIKGTTQAFIYNPTKELDLINYRILKHLTDNTKSEVWWMFQGEDMKLEPIPIKLSYWDPYGIIIKIKVNPTPTLK